MLILLCKWEKKFLGALLERGAEVILALDDFDLAHGDLDQALIARVRKLYTVVSFDSIDELSAVAADITLRGWVVDRMVSPSEYGQYGAGLLAELLGVSNFSLRLACETRDKRLMKQRVGAAGIPTARFASLPDHRDRAQRERAAEAVGFPLVIKPANGQGAMTTARLDSLEQLHRHLDQLTFEPAIHSRQLVAESFVEGEEYHLDGAWRGSRPLAFAVGRYPVPRLRALTKRHVNGSVVLPEEDFGPLYQEGLAFAMKVNAALGLERGVTHLEAFRDREGVFTFSEIATRVAGGAHQNAYLARFGRDFLDLWADELTDRREVAGLVPLPGAPRYVGWMNLVPERSGRIRSVPSAEQLDAYDWILDHEAWMAKPGEEIEVSHPSRWCLLLVIGADSEADYEARLALAAEELRIEVE